ncbi:MAG: Crp/Fnr family transcriptional regulator [Clostridia bacterium]|nr:Crp/Fnr family transcriptional regulator [Clostridia bacterium]
MNITEPRPEDWETAAGCGLFAGCERQEIDFFLEESGVTIRAFAGREIIPYEQRAKCWSIVVSGSVRIYSGDDAGGEILLNVVGAGQPFDIAALACGEDNPVPSVVKSAGKCRVAFIGTMALPLLMERYPKVAANVMEFFCGRIAFLNRKIHTLSRGTAERRLADWLLAEFSADGGKPEVTVRSCSELAVRMNLSRASLYRALGILEQSGLISRTGKRIELLDVAALQNL